MTMTAPPRLALAWELSDVSGWGVFGQNLALNLLETPEAPHPLLLSPPNLMGMTPEAKKALTPLMVEQTAGATDPSQAWLLDALRNDLEGSANATDIRALKRYGVVFFERTDFTEAGRERGRSYDAIFAGSSWNARFLKEQVFATRGGPEVKTLLQGINPTRFYPQPKTGRFGDRFVVFSGGKLEFRKGQDLLVAAFKAFQQRRPDALLLTAWASPWPETARDLSQSPHVPPPAISSDGINVPQWLLDCGLPEGSFADLGLIPNALAPEALRDADLGFFPNRCEGGTNLVAMEAMACGVPCILSANTGHLDLMDAVYPLHRQSPLNEPHQQDWGESDLEECVEALDRLYLDTELRQNLGEAGAERLKSLTWEATTVELVKHLQMLSKK